MKHRFFVAMAGLVVLLVGIGAVSLLRTPPLQKTLVLSVPYASQVPFGNWVAPFDEACEETSAIMVQAYYNGKKTLVATDVRKKIQTIVAWENTAFGDNTDTSASQTQKFIQQTLSFDTTIHTNPTIDDIKKELRASHPVISFHNTHKLYRTSFLRGTYHVVVIIGYDDITEEFIIHDPARTNQHRFLYTSVMDSLRDFNVKNKLPDGTPTVLFTAPKKSHQSVL